MFFYKFRLRWGKMKKILSLVYSLKLKNIILFLNRRLIFFSNGHIRNVVSTSRNVVKIDVENDNVVSTLSNVVQFNVEKHNVVNFNVDVRNVFSTWIWRSATSRCHTNLKTALSRRWDFCWEDSLFIYLFFFTKRFRAGKKHQNEKKATFTLLEVCAREKLLPLLFNVCLILFCWLMFLCARNLSLKKQAWNCPDSFILLYYFYVMFYYKI